jgi:hypothetical protein
MKCQLITYFWSVRELMLNTTHNIHNNIPKSKMHDSHQFPHHSDIRILSTTSISLMNSFTSCQHVHFMKNSSSSSSSSPSSKITLINKVTASFNYTCITSNQISSIFIHNHHHIITLF